jgi:hypothetical protein
MIGGFVPREAVDELIPYADQEDFPNRLRSYVDQRLQMAVRGIDFAELVQKHRTQLELEWAVVDRRKNIAPGEEILQSVFSHFGAIYKKPKDTRLMAELMKSEEIDAEIKEVIERAVALVKKI